MINLGNICKLRFSVSVDTCQKEDSRIIALSLIDPPEEIREEAEMFEAVAKKLTRDFFEINEQGGLKISSPIRRINEDLILELEGFETSVEEDLGTSVYHLILKLSCDTDDNIKKLKLRNLELTQKNKLLRQEVKELIKLLAKIESIKESFRIPFDAIQDLIISFDCQGNILVVNEACSEWFGLTPQEITRKKYKTILNQDIYHMVRKVCHSKSMIRLEEKIYKRTLQITYIPMTNRKTGKTEVVMLAQDISKRREIEERLLENGRNEGVTLMGGTIRHILNSSLHAILGFSQLALSTYDWPRETMVKYLKLIEKTAKRMKREIDKIAEQKEYKPAKYIHIPDTEDCKEIIEVELDQD